MERINEYLKLHIEEGKASEACYCLTTEQERTYHFEFYLNNKDCLFDLNDTNYKIQFEFHKTYFQKFNGQLSFKPSKQSICCNTQSKLLEIINCKSKGLARSIYIESAVLFILYQTHAQSLDEQVSCSHCAFLDKPLEVEKINNAKEYILSNLSNPLTIPIIASSVGTNQCYLKKGFKEVYGKTIFEFVQENRMVKARHLIKHSHKKMNEIAEIVGYSSLSSFSQSYKNFFGINPSMETAA